MDKVFYTSTELAEYWGICKSALNNMICEGIIKPRPNLPKHRFHIDDIHAAEGSGFNPFSPLERRRMERAISELESENARLKSILGEITMSAGKFMMKEGTP